jgi:hypothetical protein
MFPQMIDLQTLIKLPISADTAMRALILKAIYDAVQTGASITGSISSSGPTGDEMSRIFNELGAAGLAVVNSGSTFTVGWGSID